MDLLFWMVLFLALLSWRWGRSSRPWLEAFGLDFARVYARLWFRWSGPPSPLPASGPALVVANHTCSADPAFLLANAPRLFGFLTSREHYQAHWLIRWLLDYLGCVPVQRQGREVAGVRQALRRLQAGHILGIFPEGDLSGVVRGRWRPFRQGAAYLAWRSRAPVYPAYIEGGPRTHRLVRAWLWPQGPAARVRYGPPIDLSAYYHRPWSRQLLEEISQLFLTRIQALAQKQDRQHPSR
jgi:1-acyl-sn-glycerol-3-phosphate acyltransferase